MKTTRLLLGLGAALLATSALAQGGKASGRPDLEGNWRELRPRTTAAAHPGAAATPRSPLFALHAA